MRACGQYMYLMSAVSFILFFAHVNISNGILSV